MKTQKIFRRHTHNVFTEEINKIDLSSNYDKRMESIDSIKTCAYRMKKNLICKKKEIKCNNIIKQ